MLTRALQTTRGRLVILLGAVAVVLLGSAALSHFAFDQYDSYGAALWGATVHLLDPSSLQDDEGAAARAIGLFQVITGLVLLVGLLFTFVSETVARSLERLGQSDRPVRARNHLLIVGGPDLIPVAARAAAKALELRPAQFAAEAGEDYELLVTLPGDFAEEDRFRAECGLPLTRIGGVSAGSGIRLWLGASEIALTGFDHFR